MFDPNPQAAQMSDESMVRNLALQADAIWPQERSLFQRYGLDPGRQIVDVGCGTGEIAVRLATEHDGINLLGIDIDPDHLDRARKRCAEFGERTRFMVGNALDLDLPDDTADLTVCRHLLQAVPRADEVIGELSRITRSGGWLHIAAEDYGMMHFHPTTVDTDRFWRDGPMRFAERTGTDLRSGRKVFTYLKQAGIEEVRVDYVVVDTVRVRRDVFAAIWHAWRDGYAAVIAEHTELEHHEILAYFEAMLEAIRSPEGYAVWQLPIVSGRVP